MKENGKKKNLPELRKKKKKILKEEKMLIML